VDIRLLLFEFDPDLPLDGVDEIARLGKILPKRRPAIDVKSDGRVTLVDEKKRRE
jgi:hypothetical protein